MPGPVPHRPAGGLLQPRLGSKIVFLASPGHPAGEPAVLPDPAAASDRLARARRAADLAGQSPRGIRAPAGTSTILARSP
jgi:hypothetical protein